MSRRHGRLPVLVAIALVGGALVFPAGAAAASPALTGELLFYSNSSGFAPPPPLPEDEGTVDLSTTCDSSGSGTFTYTATGNANGPLQGSFTLSGNGSFTDSALDGLNVDFDINATGASSSGSLTLDPLGSQIFGTCSTSLYDWDGDNVDDTVTQVSVVGYVHYAADTTVGASTNPESGVAFWRLACFTVNADPSCDDSETSSVSFVGSSRPRSADGVGSASTAALATATDPIATSVSGPDGSNISINETQVDWPWAPSDFEFIGRTVNIYAYDENYDDLVVPADAPIIVTFNVYKGALDELGLGLNDIGIVRDGEIAGDCATAGVADPDPCIESRTLSGDQVTLVVLTTHASRWAVVSLQDASVEYEFVGFAAPVANPGSTNARNQVKAGQVVPLKWRLLADGQAVASLTSAAIATANYACGRAITSDSAGVSPGKSGLKNLGDGYYSLDWQTPKSYANSCKKMTLTLDVGGDQVTASALFEFH